MRWLDGITDLMDMSLSELRDTAAAEHEGSFPVEVGVDGIVPYAPGKDVTAFYENATRRIDAVILALEIQFAATDMDGSLLRRFALNPFVQA